MNKQRTNHKAVAFWLAMILVLPVYNLFYLLFINQGYVTRQLDVKIFGLSPSTASRVKIRWKTWDGKTRLTKNQPGEEIWTPPGQVVVRRAALVIEPETIDKIEFLQLKSGNHEKTYTPSTIKKWKHLPDEPPGGSQNKLILEIPTPVIPSVIPFFNNTANWNGDTVLAGYILNTPLNVPAVAFFMTCLAILGFAMARFTNARKLRWLLAPEQDNSTQTPGISPFNLKTEARWLISGSILVTMVLIYLEVKVPFYFTQDDNVSQFLPVIDAACESFFAGRFPTWNPYQFMGAPIADVGTYALTYPVTYLSWFIARALGNQLLTLEVFAWLHLLPGWLAAYLCCRRCRIPGALSVIGALSFIFSGYNLIAGRSWYYMTPVILWAPVLMLLLLSIPGQARAPNWRWWIPVTGLCIGIFFHAGNAQMWVYGLAFFWIYLLSGQLTGRNTPGAITGGAQATLAGIAVASPLLIAQLQRTAGVIRPGGMEPGPGISAILATFLPPGMIPIKYHPEWGIWGLESISRLYHLSYVFPLAALTAGVLVITCIVHFNWKQTGRHLMGANRWLLMGILCLILILGREGILWTLMYLTPVLGKFRVPAKFMAFGNLFLILGGGMVLTRIISKFNHKNIILGFTLLLGGVSILMNVSAQPQCFYRFAPGLYPAMPCVMKNHLAGRPGHRVYPAGPYRSPAPGYPLGLAHNFATYYRVMSIGGYDPLIEQGPRYLHVKSLLTEDLSRRLAQYGVDYVVLKDESYNPLHTHTKKVQEIEKKYIEKDLGNLDTNLSRADYLNLRQGLSIHPVKSPMPIGFYHNAPHLPVKVTADMSGFTVHLPKNGPSTVTVNFLYWKNLRAPGFPKPVKIEADKLGRVVLTIPPGIETVKISYVPSWTPGIILSIVALVSLIFLNKICKKYSVKKRNTMLYAESYPIFF